MWGVKLTLEVELLIERAASTNEFVKNHTKAPKM
jgi:hypothetical protein